MKDHREYSLLVRHSLSAPTTPSTEIDNGASRHMPGARYMFNEFTETGLNLEVVLGDDTIFRVVGCGTINFQRESMDPTTLRDVLYVPRMKKNLVLVSTIGDRAFGVHVLDGKVHVFSKGVGPFSSFSIGFGCGKLYKLLF